MQVRCRGAGRNGELQLDGQEPERVARAGPVHAAPAIESEQRRSRTGTFLALSMLELSGEQLPDARAEGNQSTLTELATPDDQKFRGGRATVHQFRGAGCHAKELLPEVAD